MNFALKYMVFADFIILDILLLIINTTNHIIQGERTDEKANSKNDNVDACRNVYNSL